MQEERAKVVVAWGQRAVEREPLAAEAQAAAQELREPKQPQARKRRPRPREQMADEKERQT